jgi:hypothetical protein
MYATGITIGLLMLIAALVKIFENDIKNYAIGKLDAYVNTAVYIQDVELSVWKKFPKASLNFKKVLILDAYPDKIKADTFFYARRLFLEFSIQDLIDGEYLVNKIEAEKAHLNIKIDEEGEGNFNIMKKSTDTVESKFDFALEHVNFKDLKFTYNNRQLDQAYSTDVSEMSLKGLFSQDSFALQTNTKLHINEIRNKALTIIKDKEATIDLVLNVNHVDTSYRINDGVFNLEQMPFKLNGFFSNDTVDFKAEGKQITLDKMMHSVNKSISAEVYNYKSKGVLDFVFKVNSSPKKKNGALVNATFKIKDGSITEPSQNLTLNNIQLEGRYSNQNGSKKEFLELTKLHAKTLDGTLNGSLKLVDFAQPILSANLKGFANLKTLHQFFHFEGIDQMEGKVDLFADMVIAINDPKYAPERFKIKKNTGSVTLKGVSIKPSGNTYFYKDINGRLILQGNDAVAKNVALKIKNTDLKISGSIKNLVPFLEDNGKLNVIASIESTTLNLDDLILPPSPTKPKSDRMLPSNINLNLDIDVTNLGIGKQAFKNIHSKVKLLDQKLIVSKMYVEHAGGSMTGNLTFNAQVPKRSTIDANIHLNKINIKQLFSDWDNFNQKTITAKNISGKASIEAKVFAVLDENNELLKDQLVAETKFTITNGGLKNVEMMKTVSGAMRDNKMVRMLLKNHIDAFEKKLLDISFETLSNTIYVNKGVVTMPKMNVSSNALDMNVSAKHSFTSEIDYHFDFLFNNLKSTPEYTEFGKVEDDGSGLRIFLHMFGNLSDPEFGWDKDQKKASRKENMEAEKQTIKSMLKQEFGMFKNDSTVNGYKKTPKKDEEFLFYDGEFDEKEEPNLIEESVSREKRFNNSVTQHPDSSKVRNKLRNNKFFKKLEDQQNKEKKESEAGFEIGE